MGKKNKAIKVEFNENSLHQDLNESQRIILAEGIKILKTLLKKNADYGCSVWKSPLMVPELDAGVGIQVRMSDKVERIIQLSKAGYNPKIDESLKDSFTDLAGYCILEVARRAHHEQESKHDKKFLSDSTGTD